jgi:tRNA(Met) cytidine acetyltransferase
MHLAEALRDEATRADERRLVVLAGRDGDTRERVSEFLDAADVDPDETVSLGSSDRLPGARLEARRSGELLGTTASAVVVDCHEACRPNALGRAIGAVDGGGLLVLLTPPLSEWPNRRDGFDETLAVPPFSVEDVAGNFRTRLVRTLRQHPGVAILDVSEGDTAVVRDGLTDPPPRSRPTTPSIPAAFDFPAAVYRACLTADQVRAVHAFDGLVADGGACVLESDRGRGKSSAAGLAAAAHALAGRDVLVTAPSYANAAECVERAHELLVEIGELADRDQPDGPRVLATETGRLRFEAPADAADLPDDPDLVVVDEAAALPVGRLTAFLAAPAVGYATTIHGYEGAGRGFSVRFRDRLSTVDRPVETVRLETPIRYAAGDPVEIWSFRALALDATPAPDEAVTEVSPADASYERLDPADLLTEEALLRETFGLLVLAHYRTEPADLARLLDAPNVSVRVLRAGGRVVAVALLAREGGLDAELRGSMYKGERVRGNMLPDVLTSQLRDEEAGTAVGQRVLRIATHPALRRRGLGSTLLDGIREEFGDRVDWLGVGYGATPDLLDFWRSNGFYTVHLSTTRNETSGEHSAIMLDPTSEAGEDLLAGHTDWFLRRVPAMLADALSDVEPDVVRAALRTVAGQPDFDLSEMEWRIAAGMAHGAAVFDTAPRPTRQLALRHLVDPEQNLLSAREERLLVTKALQARPWSAVVDALDYHSHATCMRTLGSAVGTLVEAYGTDAARAELGRFA